MIQQVLQSSMFQAFFRANSLQFLLHQHLLLLIFQSQLKNHLMSSHVFIKEKRHCTWFKNDVATFGSERKAEYLMGATNTRTVQKFDQSPPLSHGFLQHAHEGEVARTAIQGLSHLGDLTPHVPSFDSNRGQEGKQSAEVCGGHELGTGQLSASKLKENETWQPIRQLDSLWGLRQSTHVHPQDESTQEQGEGKTEGLSFDSTHHHFSGSRCGGDAGGAGTFVCDKDEPTRTSNLKGSLKCRPSAIHRGDEDAVHLHAEHDDGHGSTKCPAHSDDGKPGLLHRVDGQQSVTDAADDVQREQHGRRPSTHCGATTATSPSNRGSNGGRHGLPLEYDGKPECVGSNRPLRWPARLVTAAAVWNAVVPLSQTAAPVQAFLTTQGLSSDVWLIRDEHIPLRSGPELCHHGRALSIPDLHHQDRVSGNPGLLGEVRAPGTSDLCHQGRASSNSELHEQARADSNQGVCHQDRARRSNYGGELPECLPRPWCLEMEEINRTRLGEIWIPSGAIKTSAVFTSRAELQDALRGLSQVAVAWMRLEDVSGQKVEDRPYQATVPDWDESDGPVRCTLWVLGEKLHWLATWADNLNSILRVDEELEADQKRWAIQSTALTDLLLEEEGREIPIKGHLSDLKRCGNSLTALALHERRTEDRVDFAELFSPPRVSPEAKALGLRVSNQVFDLEAGWDVRKVNHRKDFRVFQKECRPRFLTLSPECKFYSQLMNINWERMDPQTKLEMERDGTLMWNFSLEAAEEQIDAGDYFALEHPAGAKSWKLERTQALLRRPEVALIEFDQCALGLTVVPSGALSRKRTRIATNHAGLALQLAGHQCTGDHVHIPLENNLAGKARVYPPALCHLLARSAKEAVLGLQVPSFPAFSQGPAMEWPEDEEDETTDQAAPSNTEMAEADVLEKDEAQPKVTESQKRMVLKVHVNTGHPPQEQFLRMMRAGGAHSHVLKYIKEEFQCEQCALKNRPDNRRRAHCPRSFAFNRVVSIDVLYIKFQQKSIPILNMVCTGSNYQIAQRLPVPEGHTGAAPSSEVTWRQFLQTWIRFFGPPAMLVCDSGNEFKGRFERGCESQGILQHVILPECPWQNSKAERHGGWLKEKLDKEVNSGSCTFTSLLELDEFLTYITAAKNRWFSRSGYTPAALVFGQWCGWWTNREQPRWNRNYLLRCLGWSINRW